MKVIVLTWGDLALCSKEQRLLGNKRSEKSAAVVVLVAQTRKDQTEEGNGIIVFASVVQQKSLAGKERIRADRSGTPKGAEAC
jgi:hypothetical protein